ncbi:hypothetical protein PHYBOEH_005582 [Phytophthora boehmeriae]|uniref:RxLR effector protein n=1 Tax=Phytophthora boehmeriae TaxID=109152 RepID=A0A8T1WQF0_9STRA|nr:hypothetical protein PHYBOEH_005582 [Phytophthora boehmeriae]
MWADFKASDDYIKKTLKLTGKSEAVLKSHKTYQRYLYNVEKYKFSEWITQRPPLPTFGAWRNLGLDKMALEGKKLEQIKMTSEFKSYERYVLKFDRSIMSNWKVGFKTEHMIPRDATPMEMTAKAEIWAAYRRSDDYVLRALNLDKLTGSQLVTAADYKYFKIFTDAKQAMKLK